MSALEELRAEAESQEVTEVDQQIIDEEALAEVKDDEVVVDESVDSPIEPEEPEEPVELVDELEFEADGIEPSKPKYTPEEALVHKLTKVKSKAKKAAEERDEANSELAELRKTVEMLKAGDSSVEPKAKKSLAEERGYPTMPVFGQNGIYTEAQLTDAIIIWQDKINQIESQKVQQSQIEEQNRKVTHERALKLAERSVAFITENKINPEKAQEAIDSGVRKLSEALGDDNAGLYFLDVVGDNSEKIAYFLNQNPNVLDEIKRINEADGRRGYKVASYLTNLSTKLNKRKTQISKAPAPDEPISVDGANSSSLAKKLQKQYDEESDFNKLKAIRDKARNAGIALT